MPPRRILAVLLGLGAASMLLAGCVRRTITITSEPAGALVMLNDRELGRTPVDVDFLYYGTYDVRLRRDGYEPLSTFGVAEPPLWDTLGPDLVAEVIPARLHSRVHWHYQLEPRRDDAEALLERARQTRSALGGADAGSALNSSAATDPAGEAGKADPAGPDRRP